MALPTGVALSQNASASDGYAAKLLLTSLQLMCPTLKFHLTTPDPSLQQWVVGTSAAIACGEPLANLIALDNVSNEASIVDLSFGSSRSTLLTGSPQTQRGTIYAINHVLEHTLGFRFFAADETHVPPCPSSWPSRPRIVVAPQFEYRDVAFSAATHAAAREWDVRLGLNGPSTPLPSEMGGYVSYASPPGFVHTAYSLLAYPEPGGRAPPAALYAAHPQWFWPRGAAGASAYGQLCWSNSSLISYLTAQARRVLVEQPGSTVLSISQMDNENRCLSHEEEALNQAEGSNIGALLVGVNAIADALAADFPHVAIDTLAYTWSRAPPRTLRPRPNVIVRLCTIEVDFGHPLTHPTNAPFLKDLAGWGRLSSRLYVWDYATNFRYFLSPYPNYWVLAPNIATLHANGVRGIYEEGAYPTGAASDLPELKAFVLAMGLKEPVYHDPANVLPTYHTSAGVLAPLEVMPPPQAVPPLTLAYRTANQSTSLIDTFLRAYYGSAAAPLIQAYMSLVHGAIDATECYLTVYFDPIARFLTPPVVLASATLFAAARAAAVGRYAPRVERAALPTLAVALIRWDELRSFARNTSFPWPLDDSKEHEWAHFVNVTSSQAITQVGENDYRNMTWFKGCVFGDPRASGDESCYKTAARGGPGCDPRGFIGADRWSDSYGS
jgi:hypothetical protein